MKAAKPGTPQALWPSNMDAALEELDRIIARATRNRAEVAATMNEPDIHKTLDLTFSVTEAAELVGRSKAAITLAEAEGRLVPPKVRPNGHRYYDLNDLTMLRERFQTQPWRGDDDEPVIIGVQNFKGGSGKSTTAKHFADYLALRGYRVLVVDCDSQGSLTGLYGWTPDVDLERDETLTGFLSPDGPHASLIPIIRRTQWPTVDLVPANLDLQNVEYELIAEIRQPGGFARATQRLRAGINAVKHNYDVVIIDPPPSTGFIPFNALLAANAIIIPLPARWLDFCATTQFLSTFRSLLHVLGRSTEAPIEHRFVRVLCSNFTTRRDEDVFNIMQMSFGSLLISEPVHQSEAIKAAAVASRSVYEADAGIVARDTLQRCRQNLDRVFAILEQDIRAQWQLNSGKRRGRRDAAATGAGKAA